MLFYHACTPLPQWPSAVNSYYNPLAVRVHPPIPTFGVLYAIARPRLTNSVELLFLNRSQKMIKISDWVFLMGSPKSSQNENMYNKKIKVCLYLLIPWRAWPQILTQY